MNSQWEQFSHRMTIKTEKRKQLICCAYLRANHVIQGVAHELVPSHKYLWLHESRLVFTTILSRVLAASQTRCDTLEFYFKLVGSNENEHCDYDFLDARSLSFWDICFANCRKTSAWLRISELWLRIPSRRG